MTTTPHVFTSLSAVGSGIFSSPGVIVANVNSVGASLAVWASGSILAWTGASSFAELGCAIPLNGGAQAYLGLAYNPLISYLFAWTAISALKPGGNAIIALVFGEYLTRLYFHTTGVIAAADELPVWSIKLTAISGVVLLTLLAISNSNSSTRAAVGLTSLKVLSLVSIIIFGLTWFIRGKISDSFSTSPFDGSSKNPSSYALALYSALWAVDGWDQVGYVGGEMRNPTRTIPRAIHLSMATVMIMFLGVNVAYFVVLDKETLARSNTVGLDFGRALFGSAGGILFSCMIALSCFGALNGSFYTSSRLIYAAGQEGYLPSLFGKLHKTRKTPVYAVLLQAVLTMLFIIFGGGFRSLINFSTVAAWGFYFLTVLGLLILRVREPLLERPYKTWIATPVIFCSLSLFLLSMPIIAAPVEALAALGFIAAGIPVYYITQTARGPDPHSGLRGLILRCWNNMRCKIWRGKGHNWVPVPTEADGEITMTAIPRLTPDGARELE